MMPRVIRLTEYQPTYLAHDAFSEDLALTLWERYHSQVEVAEPSFKNDHRWVLTARGWVGHIPLTPQLHLVLEPKVPVANVFRMLEYAYRLGRFESGVVSAESLQDIYEQLAVVLAKRILERVRKGLHRMYVPREECSTYVRGRIDLRRLAQASWDPRITCQYREHTADIDDNRILAWTLFTVVRTTFRRQDALRLVRKAYRRLQGYTSLGPVDVSDVIARSYHRLNEDYRPLHGLCHFFLSHAGPSYRHGEHTMVPFLIDMARLFEKFVAAWLIQHLEYPLRVVPQKREELNTAGNLHFDIDLVVWDQNADRPVAVMDTKYKTARHAPDLHEVIAYAQTVGCREAALIYPAPLESPILARAGDITVRSLVFDLDKDLESEGERFASRLRRQAWTDDGPVTLAAD